MWREREDRKREQRRKRIKGRLGVQSSVSTDQLPNTGASAMSDAKGRVRATGSSASGHLSLEINS